MKKLAESADNKIHKFVDTHPNGLAVALLVSVWALVAWLNFR